MKCDGCTHWVTRRENLYENGEHITTFATTTPKGLCEILNIETAPDFGCNSFEAGDHVKITVKDGEPWQHFVMGECPDCKGRGSHQVEMRPACMRCVGTGKVRYYDDGHIGEERYRQHPKEKAAAQSAQPDPGRVLAPAKVIDEGPNGQIM